MPQFFPRLAGLLTGMFLMFGLCWVGAKGAEPGKAEPSAKQDGDKNSAHGHADLYQLPAGNDVGDLFAFIAEIQKFEPQTNREFKEHSEKAGPAIKAACEKIL